MKNTHAVIAARAGVSWSYVTQILLGKRNALEKTARKLEAASGWSWLFWAHPNHFDRRGNKLRKEDGPCEG